MAEKNDREIEELKEWNERLETDNLRQRKENAGLAVKHNIPYRERIVYDHRKGN